MASTSEYPTQEAVSQSPDGLSVLNVASAKTEQGLTAALAHPALDLPAFARATIAVMYHVSRYYADVRVETLADAVGLSGGHLLERFKRDVGITLREYITRVRVEVAKQLMGTGSGSFEQVAEHVGLCDASHLTRLFRTTMGMTPGAYRRKIQRHR
jgi:AraC-like DNA-binding protein